MHNMVISPWRQYQAAMKSYIYETLANTYYVFKNNSK